MDASNVSRVFQALDELFKEKAITSAHFRAVVEKYPELLTESGISLFRTIASMQQTAEGQRVAGEVLHLLEQSASLGPERALRDRTSDLARDALERRTLRESEARMRAKRAGTFRATFGDRPIPQGWPEFESLASCATYVAEHFPQSEIHLSSRLIDEPESAPVAATAPKYLFRGESGIFEETSASLPRLRKDHGVSVAALVDILRITYQVRQQLCKKWNLSHVVADGLLQHYGLPTDYLDFSSDLSVALHFGCDLAVGQRGALCVAETAKLVERGRLADLRSIAFAGRPQRQSAFAFASSELPNLKAAGKVEDAGLRWFGFTFTEADLQRFVPDPKLLDAHSDRAAGLIELVINGLGKMDDRAARWVAARLQPAPFVMLKRTIRGKPVLTWVSADEAGIPYKRDQAASTNYEQWSKNTPEIQKMELPAGLVSPDLDVGSYEDGAVFVVTSDRVLDILESPTIDAE